MGYIPVIPDGLSADNQQIGAQYGLSMGEMGENYSYDEADPVMKSMIHGSNEAYSPFYYASF